MTPERNVLLQYYKRNLNFLIWRIWRIYLVTNIDIPTIKGSSFVNGLH